MRVRFLTGLQLAGQMLLGLTFFWLSPTWATIALALILHGLSEGLGLRETWSWELWVVFSPLIYIAWLTSYLIACAIDSRTWPFLFGFRKYRRITTSELRMDQFRFNLVMFHYLRERIVWNLPLVQAYMCFPGLRHLVLWATSLKTSIGRGSLLFGRLYDADLTEIGEGAVLGAGSTVTAHSITVNPDGTRSYITAPVVIGPRVVVGGATRIDIGVRIGADAMVEPMSYVPPFTTIGSGEVWGGVPARFLRRREPEETCDTRPRPEVDVRSAPTLEPARRDVDEQTLREIVALALDRPLESVTPSLSAMTCAAWDSLGQLGIAAGLQQRLGISLTNQECFQVRSMSDLQTLVARRRSQPRGNSDSSTAEVVPRAA